MYIYIYAYPGIACREQHTKCWLQIIQHVVLRPILFPGGPSVWVGGWTLRMRTNRLDTLRPLGENIQITTVPFICYSASVILALGLDVWWSMMVDDLVTSLTCPAWPFFKKPCRFCWIYALGDTQAGNGIREWAETWQMMQLGEIIYYI